MQVTDQQFIKALEKLFDYDVEKYNYWVSLLYDGVHQNYGEWNVDNFNLIQEDLKSLAINY